MIDKQMTPEAIRQAFKDRPELWENYLAAKSFSDDFQKPDGPVLWATGLLNALTELASLLAERQATCAWEHFDPDNNGWSTSCGSDWSFDEEGPIENQMKHCFNCGHRIEVKQ